MYPYENLSLEDLPHETWEDIPSLDGLYRISSFGRVKRLEIEVQTVIGRTRKLQSKIMKPYVEKQKNNTVNDFSYLLSASILCEGKKYKFSIPRLVYYCFVRKFALNNYNIVVFAKDGDGKNIKPSNLLLADIQKKQKRIFERGRLIRQIETSYDEFKKNKKVSKNPYCKQVSQYTKTGKLLKTFLSIRVAAKIARVSEAGISSVLKKRQISSGNYVWAYGKKSKIDVAGIRKKNLEHRNEIVGQKVTKYDINGKKVAKYHTISEASRKTGIRSSDISNVFGGRQISAGGFLWKRGWKNY